MHAPLRAPQSRGVQKESSFVRTSSIRRALACVTAVACGGLTAAPSSAAPQSPPDLACLVSGSVRSNDGVPIAGASVTLRGSGAPRSATTDTQGRFSIAGLRCGTYAVEARALAYNALTPRTIDVRALAPADLALALARSASSLMTIGRVQTHGGDALSTSSAPSSSLDAQAYAADGYTRLSDVLQNDISTTLVHPLGGASSLLPTPVALRGPDPTETLVDIDGHQVNNGNTGDFDLSLLDPAAFETVEVVRGISPSSLVGPDTIDGALNLRTIEPTTTPHGLLRVAGGSFNTFNETLQGTGTADRVGYAVSLHRTTSSGEVNQTIVDAASGAVEHVGSGSSGSTALAKLRYAFGNAGAGYVELSYRDQSTDRDLSAALSSFPAPEGGTSSGTPGTLNSFAGTTLQAHNAGYAVDLSVPLGAPDRSGVARTTALFRHATSLVSQSVFGPGADTSPYLYNDRDVVGDDSLQIEHQFSKGTVTLQYGLRHEGVTTDFVSGGVNTESSARRLPADSSTTDAGPSTLSLAQTQREAALRLRFDPTARLHFTLASYYSDYSSFGTSFDPRFGFAWTPDARSVVRVSLGTTFQAPQLTELFVPPVLPEAVGGYVSVGNPSLQPDHATEYGLGFEHVLETGVHRTDLSVDFYRVNLRQPASLYLPPLDPNCGAASGGGDGNPCPLSYPVNAGDGVYQGIEISAARQLAPFTTLRAGYAVRSAYLTNVPSYVQDGSLVVGEQTQGLPLHKAMLSLQSSPPRGLTYACRLVYEGQYNELNQPPFATLDARVGYRWNTFEIGLAATNVSNVYAQRFTRQGVGVPYGGLAGPLASDAYALPGATFNLSLTRRY
jgi:outer membrane receptor protein involved in Fe transport